VYPILFSPLSATFASNFTFLPCHEQRNFGNFKYGILGRYMNMFLKAILGTILKNTSRLLLLRYKSTSFNFLPKIPCLHPINYAVFWMRNSLFFGKK
jgi:hypothetical protein